MCGLQSRAKQMYTHHRGACTPQLSPPSSPSQCVAYRAEQVYTHHRGACCTPQLSPLAPLHNVWPTEQSNTMEEPFWGLWMTCGLSLNWKRHKNKMAAEFTFYIAATSCPKNLKCPSRVTEPIFILIGKSEFLPTTLGYYYWTHSHLKTLNSLTIHCWSEKNRDSRKRV
jgi:hypothetical protein